MSEDIKFYIIAWGILIAFLVIRYFNKKKDYSDVSHQQKVIDEIVRKRKESNKQKNLIFKSVDACLKYMEKFFTNYQLEKKSLYHGKILFLESKPSQPPETALVKVLCLIDGKTDYALITAMKGADCKSKLKVNDFVYIGMEEVSNDIIPWKKTMNPIHFSKRLYGSNSLGVIVKKLTFELNVTTSQFEHEE